MNKSLAIIAALTSTFGFIQLASADASDNLNVSATVESSCAIVGGNLSFGAYNTVTGAGVNGQALISVACTTGTETTVTMGEGANPDGSSIPASPARRMSDGAANFLSYALYSESTRTQVWGDTALSGAAYTATSSAPQAMTVFGRISANQDVPAGTYTDTVLATIAF